MTQGPTPLVRDALARVVQGKHLDEEQAYRLMLAVMEGEADTAQIAGIVTAMAVRGETVEEITGFARAMREKSTRIAPDVPGRLVDTCSTGGAPTKTFNVSTTSGLVAAGAGAFVAKHGNRSSTSPSGSADVLEALGADIHQDPDAVRRTIEEVGFGFLFAPDFHPAMKHAMPARRALGVRTVFNLLGPLTNPAGAQAQVLGVPREDLVVPLARVLARLGTKQAIVMHGHGGLDEASTLGPTFCAHVQGKEVHEERLDPEALGFNRARLEDIATMPPADSAREVVAILGGAGSARADIVTLNAALAVFVADVAGSIEEGVEKARGAIADGAALDRLERYVTATGGKMAIPAGTKDHTG